MAQLKLERIDKGVSRLIGDTVATAGTDGNIFSAAIRLEAINRARLQVYDERLAALGIDEFIKAYPELLKITDLIIRSYPSPSYAKPADCKKVFEVTLYDDSDVFVAQPKEMLSSLYQDAVNNTYSSWKATSVKDWKFAEFANEVMILASGEDHDKAKLNILTAISDAVMGGANTDIVEPSLWIEGIIEAAAEIILGNIQTL